MATNKNQERMSVIQLLQPVGVAITSGQLLIFGESYTCAGVAQESQVASGAPPAYDSGSGYIAVDFEGVYNLSVQGFAAASPTVPAAIKRGDPVFASGGTYDPVSGVTYGVTLDADKTGNFVGLALDPVAAGATTTIRVLLKNAASINS